MTLNTLNTLHVLECVHGSSFERDRLIDAEYTMTAETVHKLMRGDALGTQVVYTIYALGNCIRFFVFATGTPGNIKK